MSVIVTISLTNDCGCRGQHQDCETIEQAVHAMCRGAEDEKRPHYAVHLQGWHVLGVGPHGAGGTPAGQFQYGSADGRRVWELVE